MIDYIARIDSTTPSKFRSAYTSSLIYYATGLNGLSIAVNDVNDIANLSVRKDMDMVCQFGPACQK